MIIFKRTLVSASILVACLIAACSSSEKKSNTAADEARIQAEKEREAAAAKAAAAKAEAAKSAPVPKETKAITKFDKTTVTANSKVASEIEDARKKANSGDKSGAISTLSAAEKKEPRAFLVPYNKGIIFEWQGNSMLASEAYLKALQVEPKFSPALLNYVRLLNAEGNSETALSVASSYVSSNPDAFDHNIARLEALNGLQRYDDVVTEARRLLKVDEANPQLRYEIALAEYSRGRYNLAEFVIRESLEIDPNNVDALFLLAKIHAKLSETDPSYATTLASELDKVLNKQTRHVEALWMRGVLFYNAGDFAKAEKTFRMLLDIAPNLVEAYINLANVLKTVNRGPEAEKLLHKAAQLSPDNPEVDFAFGTLYMNTEIIELPGTDALVRLKDARSYFENAIAHSTDKSEIKLFKGYIKTTDDAIETLQAMRDAEALFATPEE